MTVVEQTLIIIIIIIIILEGLIVLLYIGKIYCCNDIHLLIKGKLWNYANFIIACNFSTVDVLQCIKFAMLIPWYLNFSHI